jgi:hypothetical protein
LSGREKAVDASLDAVAELLGGFGRSITLIALGSALVGLNSLGGVGASNTEASSAAGGISRVTGGKAGLLGSELYGSSGRRGAGNGGILRKSESADGEGEDNGRVLHCDCLGRVIVLRSAVMRRRTGEMEATVDYFVLINVAIDAG